MKTVCIYHSRDLDGWISGAIVKLAYSATNLIGWDYGKEIPDLNTYDKIVMVDISFPKEVMQSIASKLIWIDHHISAIKDVAMLDPLPFIEGRRNDKFAACELTWQYFFEGVKMPEIVRLLGRYDCFGHKGTDEELKVLEFQYGARQLISDVDEAFHYLVIARGRGDWDFDGDLCDDIHLQGKAIYKYLCTEAKTIYKRKFDIDFYGHKFAIVNQDRFNPINFGIDYHSEGYEGFACFWYANGLWTYSLYNDNGKVDCSEICKLFGGGGHKGAAGFTSKQFISH